MVTERAKVSAAKPHPIPSLTLDQPTPASAPVLSAYGNAAGLRGLFVVMWVGAAVAALVGLFLSFS